MRVFVVGALRRHYHGHNRDTTSAGERGGRGEETNYWSSWVAKLSNKIQIRWRAIRKSTRSTKNGSVETFKHTQLVAQWQMRNAGRFDDTDMYSGFMRCWRHSTCSSIQHNLLEHKYIQLVDKEQWLNSNTTLLSCNRRPDSNMISFHKSSTTKEQLMHDCR